MNPVAACVLNGGDVISVSHMQRGTHPVEMKPGRSNTLLDTHSPVRLWLCRDMTSTSHPCPPSTPPLHVLTGFSRIPFEQPPPRSPQKTEHSTFHTGDHTADSPYLWPPMHPDLIPSAPLQTTHSTRAHECGAAQRPLPLDPARTRHGNRTADAAPQHAARPLHRRHDTAAPAAEAAPRTAHTAGGAPRSAAYSLPSAARSSPRAFGADVDTTCEVAYFVTSPPSASTCLLIQSYVICTGYTPHSSGLTVPNKAHQRQGVCLECAAGGHPWCRESD